MSDSIPGYKKLIRYKRKLNRAKRLWSAYLKFIPNVKGAVRMTLAVDNLIEYFEMSSPVSEETTFEFLASRDPFYIYKDIVKLLMSDILDNEGHIISFTKVGAVIFNNSIEAKAEEEV